MILIVMFMIATSITACSILDHNDIDGNNDYNDVRMKVRL